MSESNLKGKRVVITGASAGLGEQCAISFARAGSIVALIARRKTRLNRLVAKIKNSNGQALAIPGDIANLTQVRQIAKTIYRQLDGCDILINNAGVYYGETHLVRTDISDWNFVLDTNLRAPYLMCKETVPFMIEQRNGLVINVISGTSNLEGLGLFRISKIGLEVLTAVLARELRGTGVSAVAFNPGWMKTESCESGHSPRAAARALVELALSRSSLLNASVIDLKWSGRKYRLSKRNYRHARFGLLRS